MLMQGDVMSGKTSNKSKAIYNAKAYDRIEIVVHKGHKAEIKAAAKSQDKSLNAFINDAIDATMEPLRNVWDKPDMVLNYKGKNMEFKVIDTKK
jgi:hypothetical protein